MRTNLEKWNYYLSIIDNKTKEFIDSQKEGKDIPKVYYIVHPIGSIAERTIIDIEYSHHKHGGRMYFNGKKPTKKDITALAEYSAIEIPFSVDNIWFKYSEIWGKEKKYTSTSSVRFTNIINRKNLYYNINEAEEKSIIVKQQVKEEKKFKEQHKKDGGYNYAANGYKFLGWQNGWKHVYYDEDRNLCSETGKPRKTFGYLKADYPEYKNCIASKHRRIEVSHNQRGSENTVSCPECKIYWKYDSSD